MSTAMVACAHGCTGPVESYRTPHGVHAIVVAILSGSCRTRIRVGDVAAIVRWCRLEPLQDDVVLCDAVTTLCRGHIKQAQESVIHLKES